MITIVSTPARRAAFIAVSAALLAACGSLIGPSEPPPQIYVLHPQLAPLPDAPATAAQLIVGETVLPDVLDTKRIAIMRGDTMDYYANAAWTDTTGDLLQGLLVEAFEKSGKIQGVARISGGVRADYLLTTELRTFSARYDSENGAPTIVVDIVAKLITASRHDVIATFDAHREAPASANSIPAAVAAFNQATGAAVEDIAGWTLKTVPHGFETPPATPVTAPVHRHRHS